MIQILAKIVTNLITTKIFCIHFCLHSFYHFLVPAGKHLITRSSLDSSVTKPPVETYADIKKKIGASPEGGSSLATESGCRCRSKRYCECGWPQRMLLPRGKASGMNFDLFVMVTDWAADNSTDDLDQGTSYCGVKNEKYPDSRAMGFPFDRSFESPSCLDDFVSQYGNITSTPITIVYEKSAAKAN